MDAAVAMIFAASQLGDALEHIGVILVALLAGAALLAPSTRARAYAAIGALAVTPVLLVADIWDSSPLRSLRDHPPVAGGAVVAGLVAVAVLAYVLHRCPALLPLLVVAALPFRVPISAGGDTANLLVPLYLVVAAGVLSVAVSRLRAEDDDAPFKPGWLEWLLCGSIVLYALQATYSDDFAKGLQNVVFFYVPFALLLGLLREVRWTQRLALQCLGVLVVVALVLVGIGFVEYARKELLLNPRLVAASQNESYFRVNSLFFDPNIYGRFLAVVMLGIATVVVWTKRTRDVAVGFVLLAVLWAGLVLSFSQSSFAALLVGLAVLAALRWSAKWTAAVVAVAVCVAVGVVLLAPDAINLDLSSSKGADKATSGRVDLIEGGGRLFGDRPVFGWGSGAYSVVFRREEDVSLERATTASHTIPVTVAAEQGIVGLAVYLALLVAALARLFTTSGGNGNTGASTRSAGVARWPLRSYVAAAFVALLVHTMVYAAFLEDPITWALLGIGIALAAAARGGGGVEATEPVPLTAERAAAAGT